MRQSLPPAVAVSALETFAPMTQEWVPLPNRVGTRSRLCRNCAWKAHLPWRPIQAPEAAMIQGVLLTCGDCGALLPWTYPRIAARA